MPIGGVVAAANVNDYKLAEATLQSIPLPRPEPRQPDEHGEIQEQGLCLDADYFRAEIYEMLERWGYTAHIRPVGSGQTAEMTAEEKEAAGVEARRWLVERTHSWTNRFRALLIRWNKKPQNYLALMHFAFSLMAFRASGLLG